MGPRKNRMLAIKWNTYVGVYRLAAPGGIDSVREEARESIYEWVWHDRALLWVVVASGVTSHEGLVVLASISSNRHRLQYRCVDHRLLSSFATHSKASVFCSALEIH